MAAYNSAVSAGSEVGAGSKPALLKKNPGFFPICRGKLKEAVQHESYLFVEVNFTGGMPMV
jgi:hypothetical protein